jgi:hypothetical protein
MLSEGLRLIQIKAQTKVRPPKETKNSHKGRAVLGIASKNLPSK